MPFITMNIHLLMNKPSVAFVSNNQFFRGRLKASQPSDEPAKIHQGNQQQETEIGYLKLCSTGRCTSQTLMMSEIKSPFGSVTYACVG